MHGSSLFGRNVFVIPDDILNVVLQITVAHLTV